jgi:uncharacterized protein (TIGR03437 family)
MTFRIGLLLSLLLVTGLLNLTAVTAINHLTSTGTGNAALERKVSPWLLAHSTNDEEAEFLVILNDRADLSAAAQLDSREEKARFVRDALWQHAQSSQASLREWLTARGIAHHAFYIVNAILVKGNRALLESIAARADVVRIEANPQIRNALPDRTNKLQAETSIAAIESGISFTRAPEVWALGFNGQGIVVASADTGVEWDHPALKNHYRGWNGATASHDYNWHDSIHTGGGICGPNATAPCDDSNHGTHTAGTSVGDDGQGNQIGMAPGAKFIICRNMDQGVGTPARYIECMEFFLAPYPVGGAPAQGDPTRAPHVSINSWGCPRSEGCEPLTLQSAIEAQRAAGIMTVVAAGNSGPNCSTVEDPPSFYDASYSVGALDPANGNIANFSSRGPATADGSNRQKPDITAPGVRTRSAVRGGNYASFQGTSMATPHVAGAVALLWSAVPALQRQIALTENILNETAVRVTSTQCDQNGAAPNNVYGYGRLDIKAAVDLARARLSASVSAASYSNQELASDSIVAVFGSNLATSTQGATAQPLPATLGGTTIKVRDSAGIERSAPLFFVSPTQANYLLPSDLAAGSASVTITNQSGAVSFGSFQVAAVAPGLFSANASGSGVAAALVQRVRNNQAQPFESVAQFNGTQFVARPIDLGPESDQVFLVLFGTGVRRHNGLSAVTAKVGGVDAQVTFAGAQPDFAGLDQINLLLPRALIGRGEVDVVLTVNGKSANIVKVSIR